jgi:hypothetical protein
VARIHPSTAGDDGGVTVDRAAYETLRSELLSQTARGVSDVPFSRVASWAVWSEPRGVDGAWVRDLEPLGWERLEPHAHDRVVLVALGRAGRNAGPHASDWAAFHVDRGHQRLARAVGAVDREVIWGAYTTAFFKGLGPTPADLGRYVAGLGAPDRVRVVDAMVALLERELEILGARSPLLVGLGADAHRWLQRTMADHAVVGITHHAAAVPAATYRAELTSVARQASRRFSTR